MRRSIVVACAAATLAGTGLVAHRGAPAQAVLDLRPPSRVLDTRAGHGAAQAPLSPAATLRLTLPPDIAPGSSVALNLTADRAAAPGWVSAWSCADPQPATSILNVTPGRPVANMVALRYAPGGVCFTASTTVDLIADVTAVMDPADYTGVAPRRLLDTRDGNALAARQEMPLQIAGAAGVPAGAPAAAINVTVIARGAPGWVAVAPCGTAPGTSTVNFLAHEIVPHFTFTGLDSGRACVTASTPVDVVVDAFGWLPAGGVLDPIAPARMLDTRNGVGGTLGALADGQLVRVRIAGYDGVDNDAAGATVNLVAVDSGGWGHVNAWPCDAAEPTTSTLNVWPGALRANQATLALSESGEICLRPKIVGPGRMHLVLDVVGRVAGGVARPQPPTTTIPPATTTPPTPPPPTGGPGHFTTLPVGAALPSGAECAGRVRAAPEIRPDNALANSTRGTGTNSRTDWSGFQRVDGDFVGTTDEIIQWAACKWGIDEDIVRAQIVKESYWHQAAVGDNGESYGLGQVRNTAHQSAFEDDNAIRSTAYNLDYTYAVWRGCYEGAYTWLNTVERGRDYAAGDAWGCLGVWFSGRWYTDPAVAYLEGGATQGYGDVGVRQHLASRTWESAEFIAHRL